MNQSVIDVAGGVLLIPQFTIVANTDRGSRPSFSRCMESSKARTLFFEIHSLLCHLHPSVAAGVFGENMEIESVNDGPTTFSLSIN